MAEKKNEIDVSVIIPCYNSGKYLLEALNSVEAYRGSYSYEIIIINDGSNDNETVILLKDLERKAYHIIHQENKGPSSARNAGVKTANGKYLFFLDSDNTIKENYLEKAVKILNTNDNIGVVYANPIFVGDNLNEIRFFYPQPFNIHNLLTGNYIDMCSIVRKSCFINVGGFDENLIGHEDWELWIKISKAGWGLFHINEELFYYRITEGSLTTVVDQEKDQHRLKYIYEKHYDLLNKSLIELTAVSKLYQEDQNRPFRSFFKFIYNKYFKL